MGTVVGIVAAGDLEIEIGSDASPDAFLLLLLNKSDRDTNGNGSVNGDGDSNW